jgi:hypothetical protein
VLSETIGVTAALLVVGFAYLAATMAPLAIPAFRSFDKPKDEVPERDVIRVEA